MLFMLRFFICKDKAYKNACLFCVMLRRSDNTLVLCVRYNSTIVDLFCQVKWRLVVDI